MEITDLPKDILLQILHRLPKLSERRLRAVSKTWRHLMIIKDVEAAASTNLRYLDSGFAILTDDSEMTLYRLDKKGDPTTLQDKIYIFPLKPPGNRVIFTVGSCNGVVFYDTIRSGRLDHRYHVFNPLTGKISRPPHTVFSPLFATTIGLALGSNSSHYKLVALYTRDATRSGLYIKSMARNWVSIFDSEKGEWKSSPAKFPPNYSNRVDGFEGLGLGWGGVYINGIIYWLNYEAQKLVAFFVEEEVFRVFRLPKTFESRTCMFFRLERRAAMWESEELGCLKYSKICRREGLCIWVLDHPHELGRVKDEDDDQYHCDISGCSSADQNNGWKLIFKVSPETLIAKLSTVIVINSLDQVERVSAFNEELYIVHIKTLKGYVSYNIPENTVNLLPYKNQHQFELPLRYRRFELPGTRRRSIKRKIQDEEQLV